MTTTLPFAVSDSCPWHHLFCPSKDVYIGLSREHYIGLESRDKGTSVAPSCAAQVIDKFSNGVAMCLRLYCASPMQMQIENSRGIRLPKEFTDEGSDYPIPAEFLVNVANDETMLAIISRTAELEDVLASLPNQCAGILAMATFRSVVDDLFTVIDWGATSRNNAWAMELSAATMTLMKLRRADLLAAVEAAQMEEAAQQQAVVGAAQAEAAAQQQAMVGAAPAEAVAQQQAEVEAAQAEAVAQVEAAQAAQLQAVRQAAGRQATAMSSSGGNNDNALFNAGANDFDAAVNTGAGCGGSDGDGDGDGGNDFFSTGVSCFALSSRLSSRL